MWLDPVPREDDIHLAYRDYYTHDLTSNNKLRAAYSAVADRYVRR
jgi:hypothetical protein